MGQLILIGITLIQQMRKLLNLMRNYPTKL